MKITEEEWDNITNYLILKINEYCSKHVMDKEDFAKPLGISPRSLARLYSKKALTADIKSNKIISALEILCSLSEALEMDVVKFFSEIIYFSKIQSKKINTK